MVQPKDIVNVYIDLVDGTFYADAGQTDLKSVGFVISSGIVVDGALLHSSLAGISANDHHIRYTKNENDAIIAGSNVTVVSGSNTITISSAAGGGGGGTISDALIGGVGITVTSGSNITTIDGHLRYTKDENDAITGSDGITITSGTDTIDVAGFRTEFVNASGTLSSEIDSDISIHAAVNDAHHAKYTDAEAITALEPTTSALAASGVATDANIVSVSGHLQSEIDGLVESENGFFFQTVTGVVTLMESAPYTRDIVDFTGRVFSGIASGTLSIDGTDVDGINNQTWNTSQSTDTATANNSIPIGGRVLLTLSGESSFERFGWTYSTERT